MSFKEIADISLTEPNRLEGVLISYRILFKRVSIMPKGRFPKLKGRIWNIPTDLAEYIKNIFACLFSVRKSNMSWISTFSKARFQEILLPSLGKVINYVIYP